MTGHNVTDSLYMIKPFQVKQIAPDLMLLH